ncbi:MAG: class I SAM-dependent methyltransferase [Bacteroides sp.]|jgi:ubiquinone/menaquinone biosynthesis C-methylase UbiE|nr:class I SAM-dependent methyltransferase [Bacteroides sp.]
MTQKIQAFWDQQAGRFDAGEGRFEAFYEELFARMGQYLGKQDQALDYGCATGTKTRALAERVGHIHGLDLSPEMIRLANSKKDALKLANVSFSQGTIFSRDLKENYFDSIIAFAIIQLLEDPVAVLGRIYELLKPGGVFISTTACFKEQMPLKTRLQVVTWVLMNKLGFFPLNINWFSAKDVERLLEDQHFQILESEKVMPGIPAVFIVARKPG